MENDPVFETYQSQHSVVHMIQESRLTSILQKIIEKMTEGWPKPRKNVSKEFQPYFDRCFQLSLQRGCILCGTKVIIPTVLREQVLAEIHEGHTGIVCMKAVARMHVWWPNID